MNCQFVGQVNPYNRLCNICSQYLEGCVPIHAASGCCLGECDIYLCEGCDVTSCKADLERDRSA